MRLNTQPRTGATVNVDIRVVGHHARPVQGDRLAKSLGAMLFEDDGTFGEYENHRRAWGHPATPGTTHICVLQDDATPIFGFKRVLRVAVAARHEDMISLYIGSGRPGPDDTLRRAQKNANRYGAAWLEDINLMWGVGVVMPVASAADFAIWEPEAKDYYDNRLGNWWHRRTGRKIQYAWPSLVNHADEESLVSTRVQPVRRAFAVGARDNYDTMSFPLFLR